LSAKAFDNVRNQIGYCGIYCGSCVVGNGTLNELTKRYEEVIQKYGLKEWAPKDFDFSEFAKGLASIRSMPPCQGCLKGGGRDNCEMRTCARSKKTKDCSECDQPDTCKNLEILRHMRSGARDAGLFVKMDKVDRERLIEKWAEELKRKWPSCILLCNSL